MEQSDIYMRKNKPWQIPHAKHKVDFNIKFKTKTTSFIVENRKKKHLYDLGVDQISLGSMLSQ